MPEEFPVRLNVTADEGHINAVPAEDDAVPAVGGSVHGAIGLHIKVKPEAGAIRFVRVTVLEFSVPAVVVFQSVAELRLLKSETVNPLNPTWLVRAVVDKFVEGAYTIWIDWLVAMPPPSLRWIWKPRSQSAGVAVA